MTISFMYFSYLTSYDVMSPSIVLLAPPLPTFFSFSVWKLCKDKNIIVYPIPNSVYSRVVDDKADYFNNFQDKFNKVLKKRLVSFIEAL